jgi:Hint domain-containing protein
MRVWVLALLAAVVACGCAPTLTAPAPTATGEATITPTPTPASGPLTQAKLKYRIVDRFGVYAFCDPDYYPVARADEQTLARVRLPEIQNDAATFGAILVHLGVATNPPYTDEQVLAIYREWKMLSALRLDPVGAGFHFAGVFVSFGSPITPAEFRVDGTINQQGDITVASSAPSGRPPCPICLARGTRIATPSGDVAVEDLNVGDIVWTIDASGARVALPLVQIGSTPVPATHRVVELRLSDGRAVDVSPGHGTADGRSVGDLRAGDAYDGAVVVTAELVAYAGGATFDVLPASSTGAYWANGIPLGSTLR